MSRRVNTGGGKRSRRGNTILWVAAMAAITIGLIYYEQTALLYILATLGVTALLAVVALADLKGAERMTGAPATGDDSAAIGSAITSALPAAATTSVSRATRRRAKRK